MLDPGGLWQKWSQKVLALLSKREVKTPLAFFFRILWAIIVIVGLALYGVLPEQRVGIFWVAVSFLVFLVVVVGVFAWNKPKNLVYGESGHRAELKLGLGTEKQEISSAELAMLPGSPNPQAAPEDEESL